MTVLTTTTASQLQSSFIRLDAEFFKTEYLEASEQIKSIPGISPLGSIAQRITQGANPNFVDRGLPCINGKNVYFGTMEQGEPNYVSPIEFQRLSGYALKRNDLVITLKHATKIGRAWLVEDEKPRIFSRNIGLIRLRSDSPIRHSVLLLYLWTRTGQLLIDRSATGGTTGQITLPISELRRLPIPPVPEHHQIEIDTVFQKSRVSARNAANAYEKAEHLLESELGLDILTDQKPIGYSARFSSVGWSETLLAGRVDAQCFAPDALLYESWLHTHARCDHLGKLLRSTAKGRQQADSTDGPTDYCSIKHINAREIVDASKCFPKADTPMAGLDDLLLAITGATIGKVGIVKRYERLAFSGDLLCLRTSESVDPHYLLLVLDHKIGQVQCNRWITGSTNGHLAPGDVARVLIPRLSNESEAKIAGLVRCSLSMRQESEQLLEQAKSRVEQLIEEAARA